MLSSEDLYVNCVNSDSSQAFIIIFFFERLHMHFRKSERENDSRRK